MGRSDQAPSGLGEAIRDLRKKQGITLEALAPRAGITTGALGMIERGESNPTWTTVQGIAGALGVSIGELEKLSEHLGGD